MRSFLHRFLHFAARRKPANSPHRNLLNAPRMSGAATAAALYAATISPSAITGATPEDVKEKAHHLKDGKGFTNPWDSWREFSGLAIAKAMIWYKPFAFSLLRLQLST